MAEENAPRTKYFKPVSTENSDVRFFSHEIYNLVIWIAICQGVSNGFYKTTLYRTLRDVQARNVKLLPCDDQPCVLAWIEKENIVM